MMSWADLVRLASLATPDGFELPLHPSFNIAPTQEVLIVRQGESGPEPAIARWGLVPYWSETAAAGPTMINARAETVATRPAFRNSFRQRRCLVPANGFYEWKKPANRAERKQPLYIRLKSDQPFAFAGLWDRWDKDGDPLETCTIITCGANPLISEFHDRMPVILPADACRQWLTDDDPDGLKSLLVPFPAEEMIAYPVSQRVNNTANNDIGCIEPLPQHAPKQQSQLWLIADS
jgi:putative SOS response-associated peptidase YedK